MRIRPLLLVILSALLFSAPAAAQTASRAAETADLQALTRRFAQASDGPADSVLALLSSTGDFTWVHTVQQPGGRRVQLWRFPAAEARRAIEGPLEGSFGRNVHGQPVGRFVHQATTREYVGRRTRWRRVRGTTRMVMEGEPDDSGFFVEWRREGGRWVVSAFGDESYDRLPLPPWCC